MPGKPFCRNIEPVLSTNETEGMESKRITNEDIILQGSQRKVFTWSKQKSQVFHEDLRETRERRSQNQETIRKPCVTMR